MQLILFCQTSAKGYIHPSLLLYHWLLQSLISRQWDGDGGDLAATWFFCLIGTGLPASWCVTFPLCVTALVLTHSQRWAEKGQNLQQGARGQGRDTFIPWEWITTQPWGDIRGTCTVKQLQGCCKDILPQKKTQKSKHQTKPHKLQTFFLPLEANHSP